MPLPKRYKYKKKQHAAAMGRQNKKRKMSEPIYNPLTISPDESPSLTTNNKKDICDNLPLTNNNNKNNLLQREINNLLNNDVPEYPSKKKTTTPKDSGNRLLHWDSLKSTIENSTRCYKCGKNVVLTELTIGIATQVTLTCQNSRCNSSNSNKVKKTSVMKNKFCRNDTAEMFAINCQFYLSLLQTGCGSTEADTFISFLDLPNGSSYKSRHFARIQNAIRPDIVKISDSCMDKARHEEIRTTLGEDLYKDFLQKKLTPAQVPLTVMYDMGWNKRSSGNKYDSMSGHGFLLGGNTKKIMNYRCMSKACTTCRAAELTKKSVRISKKKKVLWNFVIIINLFRFFFVLMYIFF